MNDKNTADAHKLKVVAEQQRKVADEIASRDPTGALFNRLEAAEMETAASAALVLPEAPVQGAGGEFTLPMADRFERPGQLGAVTDPDWTTINASRERIELADNCGAFNLAFDAAESVKARNSTERMLVHQMAAAHKAALDLLAKSAQQRDTIEQARLANTAARLLDTYQRAMLTLARTRSGGKQTVVVQHVQVAGGAQAIITGTGGVGGGASKDGR